MTPSVAMLSSPSAPGILAGLALGLVPLVVGLLLAAAAGQGPPPRAWGLDIWRGG